MPLPDSSFPHSRYPFALGTLLNLSILSHLYQRLPNIRRVGDVVARKNRPRFGPADLHGHVLARARAY